MNFIEWLQLQGCTVEITQEDDGSGYQVIEISPPAPDLFPVTTLTVEET